MNNPELRAVLAEALGRSYYRIVGSSSDCRVDPGEILADALLSLPGVAVIQLPEATYAECPDEWSSSTAPEDEWDTWVDGRGNIQVRTQGYATADGARNLAAALLAAAVVAEGEDRG
ncbi:hypothetical protein SEA_GIRR_75 [Mycobacterium phage Girr]|uniref:Uncharacterized protein n=1 Tax=Mycobacterium phage Girr TaxID=2301565 RepID=A0A385DNN2_9CAUD|nr:hypothetical protein I5H43_gp075 [Mycobacterium phage Girr]AXQ61023.1 hypothetical protein SEA_GIRR_75 [Mycobacterium phage Girr]AXQ65081.1 hypothetical protein SEA_RUBY_73 [Mycobacterium phage Ruby]QAY06111.1 hypothetical protein SEA_MISTERCUDDLES_76 [Mycobacterium phage MisterCuddles]